MEPNQFSHGGKFGDLIYCLPTMRALGGGVLFLHPRSRVGMKMQPGHVEYIKPLLMTLPYVDDVQYASECRGFDLNLFRTRPCPGNIADWCLHAFGIDKLERNDAWLCVSPLRKSRVVIHRSPRYQNGRFPWTRVLEKYHGQVAMVGSVEEHDAFTRLYGHVDHLPTRTPLELAMIIAGSELFVGNQSFPLSLAQAMRHHVLMEVWPKDPNCIFHRDRETLGWDESVILPELR